MSCANICTPCIPHFYYLIVFPFFFKFLLVIVNLATRDCLTTGFITQRVEGLRTPPSFFSKLTQVQPVLYLSPFTPACLARKTRCSSPGFSPFRPQMALSKHIFFFQGHTTTPWDPSTRLLCFTTITLRSMRTNEGNSSITIFLHLFICLFYCVAFRNV